MGFDPGPSEYVRTKSGHLYPFDHLGKHWQYLLKEVYLPSLLWLTVFMDDFFGFRIALNLKLIEARRKSHNKPIDALSDLVHARNF